MAQNRFLILIGAAVLLLIGYLSIFTVDEREVAVLRRLGQIVHAQFEPGLHFKIPLIMQVSKFDGRIMTLDAEPERYLTSEKKNVIVDAFVMWRIAEPARYFTTTGGDRPRAELRLAQIINDALRSEFGKRTIQEVVSGERRQIMSILTVEANKQAQEFGINVADVRVKRIDLPREVSQSVYRRMEAERTRVAKDLRSRGAEAAERIRADADRQRTVILAEAYRDAERLRGEGDALSTEIYSNAFGQDAEFYSFYRSLNAYRTALSNNSVLVLQTDSEFFKYFNGASRTLVGATEPAAGSPP
jgi:membrane protease subunit HflC